MRSGGWSRLAAWRRPGGAAAVARSPKGPFTPEQMQQAIEAGRKVLLRGGPRQRPRDGRSRHDERRHRRLRELRRRRRWPHGAAPCGARGQHRRGDRAARRRRADQRAQSCVDSTTPLLLAIINGQFDVAMKLIERGADVNAQSTIGDDAALRDDQHAVGAEVALSAAAGGAESEDVVSRAHGRAAQEGRESRTCGSRRSRGTSRSTTAATRTAVSRTSKARTRSGARRTRWTSKP